MVNLGAFYWQILEAVRQPLTTLSYSYSDDVAYINFIGCVLRPELLCMLPYRHILIQMLNLY